MKGEPRKLKNSVMNYKQSTRKVIEMNILYFGVTVGESSGPVGEQIVSYDGRDRRDFCLLDKPKNTNTFFRHKNVHKSRGKAEAQYR